MAIRGQITATLIKGIEGSTLRQDGGEGVPDAVLHDAGLAQPLLDTRSLYGSITYVIRTKNGT